MNKCTTNNSSCPIIVSECLTTWRIASSTFMGKCPMIVVGSKYGRHEFHFYYPGLGNCMKPMKDAHRLVNAGIMGTDLIKYNIMIGDAVRSKYNINQK